MTYTNFVYILNPHYSGKWSTVMNSSTVNISFRKDLLKKIDRIAKEESRSRSELIREAARMYIERKAKWNDIFDYGKKQRSRKDIQEQNVVDEIKKYRKANK